MSFLYARNINNELYVFSDTKFTLLPNDEDMFVKRKLDVVLEKLKKFGIIKNVIINKNFCIGSAGILEHFNELLNFADNNAFDLQTINNKALAIHLKYNRDTDFIIAYSKENVKKLFVIKDGKIKETSSCWIGSYKTFQLLTKYRNNEDNIKNLEENLKEIQAENIFYKSMDSRAFKYAVNNTDDDTVGRFIVECHENNGKFIYNELISHSIERQQEAKHGQAINFCNNASEGGYSFHIFESDDVFSLYINQLQKGIRYCAYLKEQGYTNLRIPKLYDIDEENKFIKKFRLNPSIISGFNLNYK